MTKKWNNLKVSNIPPTHNLCMCPFQKSLRDSDSKTLLEMKHVAKTKAISRKQK